MLHVVESKKPLGRIVADLETAVTRHKFGILGVHDEVCNPQQAKKVLDKNMEISTALPCRISVYEEGRETRLATIKPSAMLALYETPELKGVAEEVEAALVAIMAEAAA